MSDWLITYGSWALAPFGLLGMVVVGRKKTWGWLLAMTTQVLWATYAIGTAQYGFLIGTVSYFLVCLRNWLKWRRPAPAVEPDPWEGCCPFDCSHCHDDVTPVAEGGCSCPNCERMREDA